ncbi:uncharacterized protein [Physcomitrium patens]|uniref:uncharacterized protein n=1 Tax=Physcomitrium patens TaxID=3218 RepID=UPI003CCC9781
MPSALKILRVRDFRWPNIPNHASRIRDARVQSHASRILNPQSVSISGDFRSEQTCVVGSVFVAQLVGGFLAAFCCCVVILGAWEIGVFRSVEARRLMQVVICHLVSEGCSNCSSDGELDRGNYSIGGTIGSFKSETSLSDTTSLLWPKINVKR